MARSLGGAVPSPLRPDDLARWAAELARSTAGGSPADVLAGVAAGVGVDWDGPGRPIEVAVPQGVAGWLVLDAAREAVLGTAARRRLGGHHTPADVAAGLAGIALAGAGPGAVVADPACGAGAFLVAAAERLVAAGADRAEVVARRLVGVDLDPLAAATARAALRCWAGPALGSAQPRVTVGDGLDAAWEGWGAEIVVGNPPFLSPLGRDAGGGPQAAAMRRALGTPYADAAWLFLLLALRSAPPGGRVVLVQPESLLSSRDARPVREAAHGHLAGLWVAGERVFGVPVRVCAPVLHADAVAGPVRRWRGRAVSAAPRAPRPPAASWASLRLTGAPRVSVPAGPVVGDLATATAGFRDEFYGLAAAATEGGAHPLVTSGLIDPGRLRWGERGARLGGRVFGHPGVDPAALPAGLRGWVEARLVPKVLVATQTKVVEAVADPEGDLVPVTPVVAVVPHDPADVPRLAAALTAPVVTAWALATFGGSALSADAIKLAARQVLAAPLPADAAAWAEATAALAEGDVVACGTLLAGGDRRLLSWWRARLPPKPAVVGGRRAERPPPVSGGEAV
jgi:hypothetical protein